MGLLNRLFKGQSPAAPTAETLRLLTEVPGRSRQAPAAGARDMVADLSYQFSLLATLLVHDIPQRTERDHVIIAAYLWGVVDALGQRSQLYDVDVVGIHIRLCFRHIGGDPERVGRLAAVGTSAEVAPIASIGGRSALAFYSGKDKNAPLTLSDTLRAMNK